jgi:hypothetical protein
MLTPVRYPLTTTRPHLSTFNKLGTMEAFGDLTTILYDPRSQHQASTMARHCEIRYYRRYSRPTSQCPIAKMVAAWQHQHHQQIASCRRSPLDSALHLVLPRQRPAVLEDEEWRKEADVRAKIRALHCGSKNSCRRA